VPIRREGRHRPGRAGSLRHPEVARHGNLLPVIVGDAPPLATVGAIADPLAVEQPVQVVTQLARSAVVEVSATLAGQSAVLVGLLLDEGLVLDGPANSRCVPWRSPCA
jgi:hypothetical protein